MGMLEVSNQSSPRATLDWLSQWKACSSWGIAIDSKREELSWAEAIGVFPARAAFEIEVGKGCDSLPFKSIEIIPPAPTLFSSSS